MEENLNPSYLMGMIVGIVVGALLAGLILKLSVFTYNLLVGGPDSRNALPVRPYSDMVPIGLVIGVMSAAFQLLMRFVFPDGGPDGMKNPRDEANLIRMYASLGFFPVSVAAFVLMVKYRFPVTFLQAFMVVLLYFSILIAIVCMIGTAVLALFFAAGFLGLGR